jgi:uncharacterized membrane protein YkoI
MWRLLAVLLTLAPSPPALADGDAPHAAPKKSCLSAAETREEIKAKRLREPFAALKLAAQHFKAEALSAKLCRIDDEMVYEIALLHKDGRYFHAHVSAVTGKLLEYKRAPAAPKT